MQSQSESAKALMALGATRKNDHGRDQPLARSAPPAPRARQAAPSTYKACVATSTSSEIQRVSYDKLGQMLEPQSLGRTSARHSGKLFPKEASGKASRRTVERLKGGLQLNESGALDFEKAASKARLAHKFGQSQRNKPSEAAKKPAPACVGAGKQPRMSGKEV